MKTTRFWIPAIIVAVAAAPAALNAQTVGTTFTYQGQLKKDGQPLTDSADFEFTLWSAETDGDQIGLMVPVNGESIQNGLFTVPLDFGTDIFTGDARWLQIKVRSPAGAGDFTTLSPRQEVTPAPYALALPGLWTQQNAFSPNLISGYSGNVVSEGVLGATISGGGRDSDLHNQVTDHYGTIGGGRDHQAGDDNGVPGDAMLTTIGGGMSNTATATYATVAGGRGNTAEGYSSAVGGGYENQATGTHATISGGHVNQATAGHAAIGGGSRNLAAGDYAVVAGGGPADLGDQNNTNNRVHDNYGVIGGGGNNRAGSDDVDPETAKFATVGGGEGNTASAWITTISGGRLNAASEQGATVGGGGQNTADGWASTVSGGLGNEAAADFATVGGGGRTTPTDPATGNLVIDDYGTIGGGGNNVAGDDDGDPTEEAYATVGGGSHNAASAWGSTVAGGVLNSAAGLGTSTVGGGWGNAASGEHATVPGGYYNEAAGNFSFAAGYWAQAVDHGAFVWADSQGAPFTSTGDDQFLIRAVGGVGIGTNTPDATLTVNGQVSCLSSGYKFPDGSIQTTAATGGGECLWDLNGSDIYYNNGSVGIGVDIPQQKLHVEGDVLIRGTDGFDEMDEEAVLHLGSSDHHYIKAVWGGGLRLGTFGAVDLLTLEQNSAEVGIGTTDPDQKLHVAGNIASSAGLLADYDNPDTDTWGVQWYGGNGSVARDDYYYMDLHGERLRIVQNVNSSGETTIWTIDGAGNVAADGTMTTGGELYLGGTPGADGITFPDGTRQTTASGSPGGDIGGSGTIDYIAKFTATNAIGDSIMYDDGAEVWIGGDAHITGGMGAPPPSPKIVIEAPYAPSGEQAVGLLVGGNTGDFGISRFTDGGGSLIRTDFMIDASSGNVGIGTVDPGGMKLKVVTSGNWAGYFETDTSSTSGRAVEAQAKATSGSTWGGFFGNASTEGTGVVGQASATSGSTYGGWFENASTSGRGLFTWATATSGTNYGVWAKTESEDGYAGFFEAPGIAVKAESDDDRAVDALTNTPNEMTSAIYGKNTGAGDGIYGWSQNHHGTVGVSQSSTHAGVYGVNNGAGPGILAEAGGSVAGVFKGNVQICSKTTGVTLIELGEGLDYAEGFDISSKSDVGPGAVLVIDPDHPGKLKLSTQPYDRRVAGIVAGAKGLGSAVRLGVGQFDHDVALAGRVYCNVDASYGAIEPGDLLTTSPTPGYAMKVADRNKAPGAVLGKAMDGLEEGEKGQIMVLVTLQ